MEIKLIQTKSHNPTESNIQAQEELNKIIKFSDLDGQGAVTVLNITTMHIYPQYGVDQHMYTTTIWYRRG